MLLVRGETVSVSVSVCISVMCILRSTKSSLVCSTLSLVCSKSEHLSEACRTSKTLDHGTDNFRRSLPLPCSTSTPSFRELHHCDSTSYTDHFSGHAETRHASRTHV